MSQPEHHDQAGELSERRQEVVKRLRKALHRAIQDGGKTQRQVELENGYNQGYLSQALNGHVKLAAEHVIAVLLSMELHPADFFARIFGEAGDPMGPISEIRQKLTRYDSVVRELEAKGLVTPAEEPDRRVREQPPVSEKEDG